MNTAFHWVRMWKRSCLSRPFTMPAACWSSTSQVVGLFGHSGDEEVWKPGTKEMLDDMHLRKIDMADEIYVINVGGYIGESTKREIAYAEKTGKKINYLEPVIR